MLHFELDEESLNLCTITTPLGKYKNTHLPMGLKCCPDIAHAVMENVLLGIDAADVVVGAISSSLEHHIELLQTIHQRLNGKRELTINPLKCKWAAKEWIGLVIGSHHVASNHGRRKLAQSCK
jgi:hypothetical protein